MQDKDKEHLYEMFQSGGGGDDWPYNGKFGLCLSKYISFLFGKLFVFANLICNLHKSHTSCIELLLLAHTLQKYP